MISRANSAALLLFAPSATCWQLLHRSVHHALQWLASWSHVSWKLISFQIVVDPQHPLKATWDWFLLFTILYNTIALPFLIGFTASVAQLALSSYVLDLDLLTMSFMIVDILLTFRTGYINPNGEVTYDAHLVAQRYVSSMEFKIDVFSTFPFFLFAHYVSSVATSSTFILNIAKLPTVLRAIRLFTSERIQSFMSKTPIRRTLRFLFYFIYLAHVFACGFFFIGTVQPNGSVYNWYIARKLSDNIYVEYTDCLYWAMETMSTVGYGDNVPVTVYERAYVIFVLFCTLIIYAAVFESIAAAIASMTTFIKQHHTSLDDTTEFIAIYSLSPILSKKLKTYTEEQWNLNKGFVVHTVLKGIPNVVQVSVLRHINATLLKRVPLFQECSEKFLEALICRLHPHVCMTGDFVFKEGDMSRDMYFIKHGTVNVIVDGPAFAGESVIAQIQESSYYPFFGEISLLLGETRTASIQATSRCLLMKISLSDFLEVMSFFRNEGDVLRDVAMQRLRADLKRCQPKKMEYLENKEDERRNIHSRTLAAHVVMLLSKRIAHLRKNCSNSEGERQANETKLRFQSAVNRIIAENNEKIKKSVCTVVNIFNPDRSIVVGLTTSTSRTTINPPSLPNRQLVERNDKGSQSNSKHNTPRRNFTTSRLGQPPITFSAASVAKMRSHSFQRKVADTCMFETSQRSLFIEPPSPGSGSPSFSHDQNTIFSPCYVLQRGLGALHETESSVSSSPTQMRLARIRSPSTRRSVLTKTDILSLVTEASTPRMLPHPKEILSPAHHHLSFVQFVEKTSPAHLAFMQGASKRGTLNNKMQSLMDKSSSLQNLQNLSNESLPTFHKALTLSSTSTQWRSLQMEMSQEPLAILRKERDEAITSRRSTARSSAVFNFSIKT